MAYPELGRRVFLLDQKYGLKRESIAKNIGKDASNASRWIRSADTLPAGEQDLLVKAICSYLPADIGLNAADFRDPNIRHFLKKARVSTFEAAMIGNYVLPIPELMTESVFDQRSDLERYVGRYLLYRYDKQPPDIRKPYIQAYAKIEKDEHHRFCYEDFWAGDAGGESYTGYVFSVGRIVNIIGQNKEPKRGTNWPELWWCGLKLAATDDHRSALSLYGYVSDIDATGRLFTDRMILCRVAEDEWKRVGADKEYYADTARVTKIAGRPLVTYLNEWKKVPLNEPVRDGKAN